MNRRRVDRDWLGPPGEHSTLRGDRGLLFGLEGREQVSRVGWGRGLSNRTISSSESDEGQENFDCCVFVKLIILCNKTLIG